MNGWISAILFSACALFSLPVQRLVHSLIYRFYFHRYHAAGLWDTYYAEMEAAQVLSAKVIGCICAAVFLLFLVSSLLHLKKGCAKPLLAQAILSQSVILLLQAGLLLVSVLTSFVSLLNLLGAVLTLPLFLFLAVLLSGLLTLAGALRGIAGVQALHRQNRLPSSAALLHGILQFILLVNVIDNLLLWFKIADSHSKTS